MNAGPGRHLVAGTCRRGFEAGMVLLLCLAMTCVAIWQFLADGVTVPRRRAEVFVSHPPTGRESVWMRLSPT
jgi:hypothetical protein